MSIAVQSKKVGSTTPGLNPFARMISGVHVTKNYGRSLQRVFVLDRPFQPSLIFYLGARPVTTRVSQLPSAPLYDWLLDLPTHI
jgi:hypothetical protein